MKRKCQIEIGYRTVQEVDRLFKPRLAAAKTLGCSKNMIWEWEQGVTPSAMFLARLHELGVDVIWILTGERRRWYSKGILRPHILRWSIS